MAMLDKTNSVTRKEIKTLRRISKREIEMGLVWLNGCPSNVLERCKLKTWSFHSNAVGPAIRRQLFIGVCPYAPEQ